MNSNEKKRKMWKNQIKEYRASSLTAAKWCEEKGYKLTRLRYWIHKFNKEKKSSESTSSWAAVDVSKPAMPKTNKIKVTIGKACIEISPGFDTATFEEVISIISKRC